MNEIKWNSEFDIGNFQIDREHQNLFAIARKTISLTTSSKETLKQILRQLYEYTSTHFSNEEKYMKSVNYPDLDTHKELHKNLLTLLNTLVLEFNSLEISQIQEKITTFIEKYFIDHIINEDKQIELHTTPLNKLRKISGWKDIYLFGNELIDKEHKEIFELLDFAFKEVEKGDRTDKIKRIIHNLYKYIKSNLSAEDDYMKSISYIYTEEHKELHNAYILKINDFIKKTPNMNQSLYEKRLALLVQETALHIIQEDKKIVDWLRINSAQKEA